MRFPFSLTEIVSEVPPITIVHVGASILPNMREAYANLVKDGYARVIGFEPNTAEHAKLLATFGAGYTFLPYLIGEGGPAVFHETNYPYTSSLLEPNVELLDFFYKLGEVTRL